MTAWAACWADEPCRLQSEASQPMCQRSWSGAPALKMSPHFHCVVERFGPSPAGLARLVAADEDLSDHISHRVRFDGAQADHARLVR